MSKQFVSAESVRLSVHDRKATDAPKDTRTMHRLVSMILARYELRSLRRLYEEFDRDILLPLLLGEIALHNIGVLESGQTRPDSEGAIEVVDGFECKLKPCNAYSIAAATGLPRETVRRKIARLVEMGWLNKRHNGHLYVTSHALEHFGGLLRSRDLAELLETADRVRHLYASVGEDLVT